jgi:hypothetical protein
MFTATPPLLEHVADLIVRVSAPTVVSCSRRVIGINGGEVMGARLHGKILPGGAEFQVIRADHTTELDARYVIETHSGALIYVVNTGFRHKPHAKTESQGAGRIDRSRPDLFALNAAFETDATDYLWLARNVFVGTAERHPDRVELTIYQLL